MANVKRVGITETVLRDAHQSLIATRMTMDEMRPILRTMDKNVGAAPHLIAACAFWTRILGTDSGYFAAKCQIQSSRCCSEDRIC